MEVDLGSAFLAVGVLLVFVIVGDPLLIRYSSRKTTRHAPSRKTTQHAPLPPPPLWRRVLSLPHTRWGWWSIGLAAPALVSLLVSLLPVQLGLNAVLLITMLVSALVGGVVGLIAVAHRERSLLVWVAQVPAVLLITLFFGFGHEGPAWVPFLPSVLFWAAINFGIIWSFSPPSWAEPSERRSS